MTALEDFAPLVGEWKATITMPGGETVAGATTFEWMGGGGYLIQRSTVEPPEFPDSVSLIGPQRDTGRIVQHYFDGRGVARIYDASLAGGELRFERDDEDFAQRYVGRMSADGATIDGAWERCDDGTTWEHDFALVFTRVD